MKKSRFFNIELVLLLAILAFAFFLRVYALGSSPFWIDEATSSMASKMILEKGVPVFDSGLVYSRAYVFHYTQSFFLLFGINEFNARLASVLFGILTIILGYFIGREYSKSGGIITALFLSIFFLEVFYSRQARFYQLFQLMFFLSIYLLYKSGEVTKEGKHSKKQTVYLILSLIAFFIALDTQIAALVLAPFFILHILIYNTRFNKILSIIPAIPLIQKFMPAVGLSSAAAGNSMNYFDSYFSFTYNIKYMLVFFIPGIIWSFIQKKKLTLMIILPSIVLLIGIFGLRVFALRYAYFIVFPLVLYCSLLLSLLYDKFGKLILISIILVVIFPSNLVFPHTYANIIIPVTYNHGYNDYSSPETNYKALSDSLVLKLRSNTIVSFFSSDVEWYIKKPSYVIPFSMDGYGEDQISWNKTENGKTTEEVVDRYSGALMIDYQNPPNKPFYVIADSFSFSKLKPGQKNNFNDLVSNCSTAYSAEDLKIYSCE